MDFKNLLSTPQHSTFGDIALLIFRLVAGYAFVLHGLPKIQSPFSWMGEDAFAPGIFQALAAVSEFFGGIAWILGLLTPLASLGIGATMIVATYTHAVMRGDPFVGRESSYELALVYLCLAVLLIALGPGRLSLDTIIFGERKPRVE